VYEGLEGEDDPHTAYLRRLFAIVDGWRDLFAFAAQSVGQNINYGLENLAAARRDFPAAACVGYTRKSLLTDAVEVLRAGVDGLEIKPGGAAPEDVERNTSDRAEGLLEAWEIQVTQRYSTHYRSLAGLLVQSGRPDALSALRDPDSLSDDARDVLGPGDMAFLRSAAAWWRYTGQSPLY
jgi:hypothetical protein